MLSFARQPKPNHLVKNACTYLFYVFQFQNIRILNNNTFSLGHINFQKYLSEKTPKPFILLAKVTHESSESKL